MTKSELKCFVYESIEEYRYNKEIEESNLFIENLALECNNFNSIIANLDNNIIEAIDMNDIKEKAKKFGETIKKKIDQLIKKINEIIHYWSSNIIAKAKTIGKSNDIIVFFTPFNINYTKLNEDNDKVSLIREPEDIERMMSSFSTVNKNEINKIISITKDDKSIESTIDDINKAIKALNNERKTIKNTFTVDNIEDTDKLLVVLSNISKILATLATSFKVPNAFKYQLKTGKILKDGKTGKYFWES